MGLTVERECGQALILRAWGERVVLRFGRTRHPTRLRVNVTAPDGIEILREEIEVDGKPADWSLRPRPGPRKRGRRR